MKIAHECMNSIQNLIRPMTDYDYYLVHLFDLNPTYLQLARNSVRMRILDNSIFELGDAYDPDRFKYWIKQIEPNYSVIPDVLDDTDATLLNVAHWFAGRPPKCTKYMAVAQGETLEDLNDCFKILQEDSRISLVGISFNSKPFDRGNGTVDENRVESRREYIQLITDLGKRKLKKPIHLLGCSLPQEVKAYKGYPEDVIFSIDTSSPVVHGYNEILFTKDGVPAKVSTPLHTLIDATVTERQKECILQNVVNFKWYVQ